MSLVDRIFGRASIERVQMAPPYTGSAYAPLFLPPTDAGNVQPLAFPSFRSGVDRKASMVGTLPIFVETYQGGVARRSDFVPQILYRPDPSEDRFTTLHKMVSSFVYHGEVVAPITSWDGLDPQSLVVVDPSIAQLSPDGQTWKIGTLPELHRSEVLHLVRFPLPGTLRGVGSVQLNRDFFAGLTAQERFQRQFYTEGGSPSVVVHMQEGASNDDINEAERSYQSKMGTRKPLFVPGGMKLETFTLSNVDMQYLQSREISLTDIANIVGLPGYYVGAPNASMTYSNVIDQRRELVDIYLRPDIILIEAGLSALLPDGQKAKLDTNALTRTDPMATAELLTAELEYKTMNEVRDALGLAPVPGGDVIGKHYTPPTAVPGGIQ